MVYQGTGLGSQLWNLIFEDASNAIQKYMFEDSVYAYGLNAHKELPGTKANEQLLKCIGDVQKDLYAWGDANQVGFEPAK